MAQASMHKIAWSVLTACCGLVIGQGASAQESGFSSETQARILEPLMSVERPGVQPLDHRDISFSQFNVLQDGASRYGREALRDQSSDILKGTSSAFDAPSAYLGEAMGGRVSLSVYNQARDPSPFRRLSADYVEVSGLSLTGTQRSDSHNVALLYENEFESPGSVDGLDFGVSHRTAVSLNGDGPTYEAGASVRLGQYLTDSDSEPAWWFFAGADRQAVLYDPRQGLNMRNAVAMESYALVGDAQAGVALKAFGADLSVAYIHRETTFSLPTHSWDTNEGFAAFSLTLRR